MIDVHDDLVAALAGRYEIERELGHGGMATVYLARDVRHDRHVALKVLRADLSSTLGAERFVREINIAARLSHPHILALYDSGSAGNTMYYVMPHVAGETLRQRLDREHQLPLDEALAITRQVASALDYAHAQGVVHRDIKPENILLLDDHVLVADFGLARALYTATSAPLTGSAVAVGTPAYMSPEQAAADPQVDGRTDLYSLACVLFEMVTGSPPFHGATVQVLMLHHINSPPPSMCAQRAACPPWVDEAVQRALAKMPADRFRTAAQFVRALDGHAPGATPVAGGTPVESAVVAARAAWSRRAVTAALAMMLGGGALFLGWRTTRQEPPRADTTVYYVTQFEHRGSAGPGLASTVMERVNDALSEWRGLTPVLARSAAAAAGSGEQARADGLESALEAAKASRARWLLRGDVAADGDSLTVRASLYDVHTGTRIRGGRIRHASAGVPPRALYRTLVNAVLRSREELPWNRPEDQWTPSLPAWAAYDRGREAIARWDLETAQSELESALAAEPELAQAQLWLAQLGMWTMQPADRWTAMARLAHAQRPRLDSGDAALAEAQLHMGEGRYPSACAAYRRVVQHDSTDFRGWLGLGDCQSRDSVVVPAADSRSRYRFRSSHHSAALAYLRARVHMPQPHPAFLYERLTKVLFTEAYRLRFGRLDTGSVAGFGAFPALVRDSIAFVPYPMPMITAARPEVSPVTQVDALDRNRSLLRSLYLQWVTDAPSSIDAHTSLATLLEMTEELEPAEGRRSALGEIATARSLNAPSSRLRALGRTQVRLLVKAGRWGEAKVLVDSLFAASRGIDADEAGRLAGAAALTGRLGRTGRLLAHSAAELPVPLPGVQPDLPAAVRRDVLGILPRVALGVCDPRVDEFPRELERRLESYYPDPTRARLVRDDVLRRLFIFAAPCGRRPSLDDVDPAGDHWLRMLHALTRADSRAVLWEFAGLQRARHGMRPGEAAVEGTFIEAWLLSEAGDTAAAIAHLDHTLRALPTLGSRLLDSPMQSAGLVRAMALRAELAARRGDRTTAGQWASAVETLWRDADAPLQPVVQRMRAISAGR